MTFGWSNWLQQTPYMHTPLWRMLVRMLAHRKILTSRIAVIGNCAIRFENALGPKRNRAKLTPSFSWSSLTFFSATVSPDVLSRPMKTCLSGAATWVSSAEDNGLNRP